MTFESDNAFAQSNVRVPGGWSSNRLEIS